MTWVALAFTEPRCFTLARSRACSIAKMPTLKVPVETLDFGWPEPDVGFDFFFWVRVLVSIFTPPLVASTVDPKGTDFVPLPSGAKPPLGRLIRMTPQAKDALAVFPATGARGVAVAPVTAIVSRRVTVVDPSDAAIVNA
jgi:hypothetical protein